MTLEPSKRCKSVETPHSRDLRLKMEVSELLADVNDFLWQYYGRPQYIIRKLQFCPWTILKEDLEQIKAILERAPNPEQLSKCRQLVMAQATQENKGKLEQLERGIEIVKKVKEHLVELLGRVRNQLSSTGNISPALTNVKAISAVKFATMANGNSKSFPKSTIWHVQESKLNSNSGSGTISVKTSVSNVGLPNVIAKSVRKLYTAKQPTFGSTPATEVAKTEKNKVCKHKSPSDQAK